MSNQNDSAMRTVNAKDYRIMWDVLEQLFTYFHNLEEPTISEVINLLDICEALGKDKTALKSWIAGVYVETDDQEILDHYCESIYSAPQYLDKNGQHFHVGSLVVNENSDRRYTVIGLDLAQGLIQVPTHQGATWMGPDYFKVLSIPHWVRTDVDDSAYPFYKALVPPFDIADEEGDLVQGGFVSLQSAVDAAKAEGIAVTIQNGYGNTILNVVPLGGDDETS